MLLFFYRNILLSTLSIIYTYLIMNLGGKINMHKIGVPLEGFAEFSKTVAANGAVLIKNQEQILPIKTTDSVSIFGRTQINYYRSGTGSGGSVNVLYSTNLLSACRTHEAITINEDLATIYEAWVSKNPFDNGGGRWACEPYHQKEMPLSEHIIEEARRKSNKAIIVIGRTAGEDKDNTNQPGSYQLTDEEKNMLQLVTKYFKQVVVVLNVANIIDMNWVNDPSYLHPIQGVLYVWQGGMEGANAVADLLAGTVTPSGKLTDTIAYSLEDYPSASNYGSSIKNFYQEDIYVGYRYFETFCPEKVQYEFGYGLSYTQFEIIPKKASLITKNNEKHIQLEVLVKNIGTQFAGKEVIQVYYSAPQGKLGKPAKALIAFEKTDLLAPGTSQTLVISFPISQMASYDDSGITGHKSAYILEPGEYIFYVGNSVKNVTQVHIDGKTGYHQASLEVILQLKEALAPTEAFTRIKPGSRNANGTYEITYENVPTQSISLSDRIQANLPESLPITGDKGYTLKDVYKKKIPMATFIAQLTKHELATLVRGEGMSSPLVTPGTASAFGGVSDNLVAYGIPVACSADGPSGIRMESGLHATQIPIGTLLAATWDTKLVKSLYELEGKELLRNQIDLLLGPGLNIKRYPLNGRNFEYFSEDPLISGVFAAAITKGLELGGGYATLKHFACNNQEKERSVVDAIVSERAIREIYLKGFELAVKQGGAKAIMTAYNPLNGHQTASNYDLITTILREEWGFKGIVMTDWWAKMNDVVYGGEATIQNTHFMVRSQNDLYMVVGNYGAKSNIHGDYTLEALDNGTLQIGELQRCAMNICNFLMETTAFSRTTVNKPKLRFIKASSEPTSTEPHSLARNSEVAFDAVCPPCIQVSTAGAYHIIVNMMSPQSSLSQTASNVYLNNELIATIQSNGTSGKWITQKIVTVELECGNYQLNANFIKPGLQIGSVTFQLVPTNN